jgi:hypothetical protein
MKELETTETFVVEKVLDKEVLSDGKVKHLVKWYGYGDKDNSWELPQESFQAAINEYKAAQKESIPSAEVTKAKNDTAGEKAECDTEASVAPIMKQQGRPL